MKQEDFLVEIFTEELPPKALLKLAETFCHEVQTKLEKASLAYDEIKYYATPRRLAVFVKNLMAHQPDQTIERKGPAVAAAFDVTGKPTPACAGFAKSCGVKVEELKKIKTDQGEWLGFTQQVKGKSVQALLPAIVEQALQALPIPKRMRWGAYEMQFARPVHSIIMLYGDEIIPATILGCASGRITHGHRFLSPGVITIPHAANYESLLETQGRVIVDFAKRFKMILTQIALCEATSLKGQGHADINEDLLTEVTGIVEWPTALCGKFDDAFLQVPKEVLISAMQDHQRYFPVMNVNNQLLPYFIFISNIEPRDPARVIHGNERVLRARLADAAFFYEADCQETLVSRIERLKGIVFQAKLGTLYDKSERVKALALMIAKKLHVNEKHVARATELAKTDLVTNMVGEFPELQGTMGRYYALHDKEANEVAVALEEQYLPRFAGDVLPQSPVGQVLALADRIDTLVGAFRINQIPTGDKDPYGLRRAALGVLRILVENQINLDLKEVLAFSEEAFPALAPEKDKGMPTPAETTRALLAFFQDRLRAWYIDQDVTADVFAAVAERGTSNPLDTHARIHAVQAFKKLAAAESLSVANKRVSNILSKTNPIDTTLALNSALFEDASEKTLAQLIDQKSLVVNESLKKHDYDNILLQLAELHQPVDSFFEKVMVMTDDKARQDNRLLLLGKLRELFLKVADIALLQ